MHPAEIASAPRVFPQLLESLQPVHLLLQLHVILIAISIEDTAVDRGRDSASRLGRVRAVSEPALLRELLDVRKTLLDIALTSPQLEFAHAGRIDDHAAVRVNQQGPSGRRMPSLADGAAHRLDLLPVFTEQQIDDRGLADAG